MQSELKPCAHETQCAKHTDTSRSDHPVKRMLDFATNRVETQAAEITRLTEALRAAEKLLAEIKFVSDVILAPICAASGRYIYDWAACPNMIEELYSEDVCIPAKAFHDLYMATNYDIVVLAQALAGAKP